MLWLLLIAPFVIDILSLLLSWNDWLLQVYEINYLGFLNYQVSIPKLMTTIFNEKNNEIKASLLFMIQKVDKHINISDHRVARLTCLSKLIFFKAKQMPFSCALTIEGEITE